MGVKAVSFVPRGLHLEFVVNTVLGGMFSLGGRYIIIIVILCRSDD